MRFHINSKKEKNELKEIVWTSGESYFSQRHRTVKIFSGYSQYVKAYGKYRSLCKSSGSMHLEELKINFPMFHDFKGELIKPLTLEDVVVHMLELPIYELPMYINSECKLVVNLAAWRLRREND